MLIETSTGKLFNSFEPEIDEIDIEDISHALSMVCRFGGHCNRFYSVAEHSVHLCNYFIHAGRDDLAKYALLHDAAEAYFLGDVPRPLKACLSDDYHYKEKHLESVINEKFGLCALPVEIKKADVKILMTEKLALFNTSNEWSTDCEPLDVKIKCWSPNVAKRKFMELFERLFK